MRRPPAVVHQARKKGLRPLAITPEVKALRGEGLVLASLVWGRKRPIPIQTIAPPPARLKPSCTAVFSRNWVSPSAIKAISGISTVAWPRAMRAPAQGEVGLLLIVTASIGPGETTPLSETATAPSSTPIKV